MSKAKKRKRENWQFQADLLFAAAIRGIGYCENCGSTERLQCAHVHSRRYLATRVDFRNAVCLCSGCHWRYTQDPLRWEDWCRARIGAPTYDLLRGLALGPAKVDWKAEVARLLTDVPMMRPPPVAPR